MIDIIYILTSTNNSNYTNEFKTVFKVKPSPEQVCYAANPDKPLEEWIGMGMFLLDNPGREINGFTLNQY